MHKQFSGEKIEMPLILNSRKQPVAYFSLSGEGACVISNLDFCDEHLCHQSLFLYCLMFRKNFSKYSLIIILLLNLGKAKS